MTGGTSTVAVTTSTGQTVTSTPGTNTKVVDESGNVVAISKNGTATQGKYDKNAFGQGATNSEVAQAATDDKLPKVTLTLDTSKPYYGYDTSAGGEPWVSIQTGKSVSLTASVDLRKSSHKATDIRYRTNDGMVVDATGSNPATLTAKGLYSGTAIPILAVADTGKVDSLKTSFVCGKINTVGYDPEYRRVWLVPVNGAKVDKEAIAKKLSAVYRQAVVEWDVQCDPKTMSLTLTDEELKGICKDITVGIASNYTIEQQAVLKKFGREPEERSYILFMVDGKAGDATGFMPLNRSAGFIYLQGQSTDAVARTVAHELGHGAFGLAHEGRAKDNTLAATDNLMDYSGGTALTKAQWDAIHSEYRRLKWFQGEDEGKNEIKYLLKKLIDNLKESKASTSKIFTYTENDFTSLDLNESPLMTTSYEPVKMDDGKAINLAVEFMAKSGSVDLSVSDEGIYSSVGISINLQEKYHTQFSVSFYSQQKEPLFKIWATSYEDFTAFLSYVGWGFTSKSKAKVVELYRNATNQAKNDPDKLDVIFETIPPFVLEKFSDAEKWGYVRLLNSHSKGGLGTDEYKALVNLLGGLTPQGLFTTNDQDASVLSDIVQKCPNRNLSNLLYAFASAGSKVWSDGLLDNTGSTYSYLKEVGHSFPENVTGDPSKWYALGGVAGTTVGSGTSTTYELGVVSVEYDNEKSITANKTIDVSKKQYAFYNPVLLNVSDDYSLMVPAFAAYHIVKNAIGKEQKELLNFGLTVLLPEINLKAFRALGKVFREEKVTGAGDVVFGSAREFVRTKYGQSVLNQLTSKFGSANDGAAAVILQKWGDDGLAILNKSTVKNIDDVVNELLKGKMAYRHIGSKVDYLEQLKTTGVIPEQIGQGQTYFSLDKIDNPVIAIDKMQLNAKKTDAVWRAEFDAAQLIGRSSFPKGKWNNAEYIEVLTRSYRDFGDGGASQFITQSQIKLKRLVNLKTGKVINFK